MTNAPVVMLLLVVFVACAGMGGISLKATIDQTSVSMYAGICITDWKRLLIVGEPGHWGGVIGLSSVGPWSHAKRWCDGGHRKRYDPVRTLGGAAGFARLAAPLAREMSGAAPSLRHAN